MSSSGCCRMRASEIGLAVNRGARVYVLPCIAGHVGADAAGVVLAEAPQKGDINTLVVDVGTNAEIVVGNSQRMLAASSPTGPAFEGAQISSGQRAAPGAIERIRINSETLEPRFRVIGVDRWSDEDGFDEAVKATGITGICGSGIIEVLAEMYLAEILTADGVINGAKATSTPRIEADGRTFAYRVSDNVVVTQNDVRAIQLHDHHLLPMAVEGIKRLHPQDETPSHERAAFDIIMQLHAFVSSDSVE